MGVYRIVDTEKDSVVYTSCCTEEILDLKCTTYRDTRYILQYKKTKKKCCCECCEYKCSGEWLKINQDQMVSH